VASAGDGSSQGGMTFPFRTTAGFIGGRLTPAMTPPDGSKGLPGTAPVPAREAVQRWRVVLARDAIRPETQRDQVPAWEVALAGTGLPVAGLDAAKPRARLAIAAPLAASIPGEAELMDVWLVERLPAWRVREALLACVLPAWHLVEVYDVWLGEPALPGRVVASVYRASLAPGSVSVSRLAAASSELLAASELPRERSKGDTLIAYDLRPFLDELEVSSSPRDGSAVLRMTLRHDPEKGIGRPEEALAALGERVGAVIAPVSIVRERLVLAELSPPPPASPRRRTGRRTPGSALTA
jgi:hypothetical protein